MQPSRAGFAYSFIYACEEPHKYRVREIRPAWQVAVARAAVGVGRVRQAREGALEVEEKDAVPLRVSSGKLAAASVATRSRQHFARGIVNAI